ncbi:hypothetical protein [Streptomyces sp. NPDC057418]|uniref:wHTH domain-containing protein n=1 Tax=unclassified Streptomyces TaxID=2593676 RepID=UPI0036957392
MSHAPEPQDPDDRRIASRELDGRRLLEPGTQVAYGHVLYAAALLGRSPAEVVSRLTALGYDDVQDPGFPLPDAVRLDDAALTRREGHDSFMRRWIDVTEPVSLRQLVETADHAGRAPADVARRLTALGFRLGGSGPLPESPNPRDVRLIRTDAGGGGTWLDWGEEVPAQHVLAVATHLACSPHTAATRLAALGLRLPYTPDPGDEPLLRISEVRGPRWLGRYQGPPMGHVLSVARETGRSPADVVGRLKVLGIAGPGGSLPDSPSQDDLVILSAELDGRRPWLERNLVVGPQMRHILRAALVTGRSPAAITARLTELGHRLHENANLPEAPDEADILLLETVDRSHLDGVHLENVLRSASLTGRSPADVASRLTALGYRLPDEVEYPEVRGAPAGS